jgi:hypothetical protein
MEETKAGEKAEGKVRKKKGEAKATQAVQGLA